MIYCDTSLVVAGLTIEPHTGRAQRWLGTQEAGTICTSPWTITEVSSALAIKRRHGQLDAADHARALANWREQQQDMFVLIPVSTEAFTFAARFCDMKDATLRAGDALHLAVVSLGGHALATLDERMREAAEAVGVRVVGVGD